MAQSTGASSTDSSRGEVTLTEAEIERRIQAFKRIAFAKLFVGDKAMSADENDESNQVVAVMRSMVLLANDILRPHDASVVLTRTEEDSQWGTQVYVRLACKDESNEQALLQHLVDTIKRDACLMRPTLIESQLDGTLEAVCGTRKKARLGAAKRATAQTASFRSVRGIRTALRHGVPVPCRACSTRRAVKIRL